MILPDLIVWALFTLSALVLLVGLGLMVWRDVSWRRHHQRRGGFLADHPGRAPLGSPSFPERKRSRAVRAADSPTHEEVSRECNEE